MTQDKGGTKIEDLLGYGAMISNAMRNVARMALVKVAKDGLPGGHHFYITFDTQAEGVEMADWLRQQYPNDMTIVLQNKYWGLECYEDFFQVQLAFNKKLELLHIPYNSLVSFADPAARLTLQFRRADTGQNVGQTASSAAKPQKKKPVMRLVKDGDTVPLPQENAFSADSHKEKFLSPVATDKKATAKKTTPPSKEEADNVVSLDAFRKK